MALSRPGDHGNRKVSGAPGLDGRMNRENMEESGGGEVTCDSVSVNAITI